MPSLLKTASPNYERIKKMDFKQKLIDFENNFLKEFTKVELYELDAVKNIILDGKE